MRVKNLSTVVKWQSIELADPFKRKSSELLYAQSIEGFIHLQGRVNLQINSSDGRTSYLIWESLPAIFEPYESMTFDLAQTRGEEPQTFEIHKYNDQLRLYVEAIDVKQPRWTTIRFDNLLVHTPIDETEVPVKVSPSYEDNSPR